MMIIINYYHHIFLIFLCVIFMNDESVLNDIKKYDDFFIVEDNILWEVFDDKCSKAEVIWDKENICELLNKLYNENEQLKNEMIDKEFEIIGLEDKRFITNEVGCVVDLEDSKLTNYDGDEIINLLNSLNRKIKNLEEEIEFLKNKR